MNAQATEIAEIISTRISHDLIGNIGAVGNAVELLEEGDMDFLDDIKSILKISSGVLNSRMKFFRMAFGLSNANLEDSLVVEKTIRDYLSTLGNKNFPIELDLSSLSVDSGENTVALTNKAFFKNDPSNKFPE